MLCDPNHTVTRTIMYLYSMETFIPQVLNLVSRRKDMSYVDSLGPFATVLN